MSPFFLFMKILLSLIIGISTKQSSPIFQHQHQEIKQKINQIKQRWTNYTQLVSFEQTINSFPFLVKNIKATTLAEIVEKADCQQQLLRFAIISNQVYSFGKIIDNEKNKKFKEFLTMVTKNVNLPDLYFVVTLHDGQFLQFKDMKNQNICKSLPWFALQKNVTSSFGKTKFLIPNIFINENWEKDIVRIKKEFELQTFENKISEVYQINRKILEEQEHRLDFLKYKYVFVEDNLLQYIPYVLSSNSLLLISENQNLLWFQDNIIPGTHFLMVDNNIQNVSLQMIEANQASIDRNKIYQLNNQFANKYFSQKAMINFTAETLKKYAQIQNLSLTQQQKVQIKRGADINVILHQKRKKQQQAQERMQIQKWQQNIKLISFDETIETFPFLKSNVQTYKLFKKFHQEGGCQKYLVSYIISDNEVFVQGIFKDHVTTKNITALLESLAKKYILPDMYLLVHIQDELHPKDIPLQQFEICRQLPLFMLNKNTSSYLEQTKFLLPDPYVIQNWAQNIKKVKQFNNKLKWENKISKAFFRGLASGPSFYDHKNFDANTNIYRYFHRGGFVLLSNERPDLIQARFTSERFQMISRFLDQMNRRVGKQNIVGQSLSLQKQLKYKYLLSADGFGASWRRIPIILFSNSILLKPFSQKMQWFYDKMIPRIHFIPINKDLSNLITKIQDFNKNDTDLKQIIPQANQLAEKYLTPQAIQKYTFQTLSKYAQIQKLQLSKTAKQMLRNYIPISKVIKRQIIVRQMYSFAHVGILLLILIAAISYFWKNSLFCKIYLKYRKQQNSPYKSVNFQFSQLSKIKRKQKKEVFLFNQ